MTYHCSVTGATPVPNSAITCGATTTVNLSGAGRDGSLHVVGDGNRRGRQHQHRRHRDLHLDTTPPPAPTVVLSVPGVVAGQRDDAAFSVTDTEAGVTLHLLGHRPDDRAGLAIACGATTTVDLTGAGRDGTYTLSVECDRCRRQHQPGRHGDLHLGHHAAARADGRAVRSGTRRQATMPQPSFSVTDTEAGVTFTCSVTGPTTVPGSAIVCGPTTTVDLSGAGRDGTLHVVGDRDRCGRQHQRGGNRDLQPGHHAAAGALGDAVGAGVLAGQRHSPQFAVSDTEAGGDLRLHGHRCHGGAEHCDHLRRDHDGQPQRRGP